VPPAPLAAKRITHHRVRARRAITVYKPDAEGGPDVHTSAYALNRIDLAGHCTYLRSNNTTRREFHVSVVRPPQAALPAWFERLGLLRHPLLLAWGSYRLSTQPISWAKNIDRSLLAKLLLALVTLWALGWWHTPRGLPLSELLLSRYSVATVLLIGACVWHASRRHVSRIEADMSPVHSNYQYTLAPPPPGIKAGIATASLGDSALQVLQGRASNVVHWLHPGPETDGAHHRPHACYRFEVEGRQFEGRTARQDHTGQPFIVEGDLLRMAVERIDPEHMHVVAFANLSDGHMVLDESDERVQVSARQAATAVLLLALAAPALLITWLAWGPQGDTVSSVLLGLCLALGLWVGITAWLRRELRAGIARALGADLRELSIRSVHVAPLPATYFD
jgi:hypothetical protein